VLHSELPREEDEAVGEEHREVPEVLVRDHHVNDDRERHQEQVVGEVHAQEEARVQPGLDGAVAHAQLRGHRRHHQHRLEGGHGERQAAGAPQDVRPLGHGRRAGDLPEARLAVAPHQLPGVEEDEQQRHHGERREGVRDGVRQERGRWRDRQAIRRHLAGSHHHDEHGRQEHGGPAPAEHDHTPGLAREGGELPHVRARAEAARPPRRAWGRRARGPRRAGRGVGGRLHARRAARPPPCGHVVLEPEPVVSKREDGRAGAQPERAVAKVARREPGDLGPLRAGGPRLADLPQGRKAQRIEQRGEPPLAGPDRQEHDAEQRPGDEQRGRHPACHRAPREGGQGERQARRDDGVGQSRAEPGGRVAGGAQGAENLGSGA
jgi:hypothetical protein